MKKVGVTSFQIAEGINEIVRKDRYDNAPAFTHYVHNTDKTFYRESAYDFLSDVVESEYPEIEITQTLLEEVMNIYLEKYLLKPKIGAGLDPHYSFIDLFAGIGGFRIALQDNGGECVFSSEWDRFARQTYLANYGDLPFGDITKIDESDIPDHDILVGGFPCQPFSLAGVSKKNSLGRNHGFLDETQGTLFFDIARIIKAKRPKAFILENVKNLRSHDKRKTFALIVDTLDKLGYKVSAEVLDAKYYVPQHRERIFIVGFNKKYFNTEKKFSFPKPQSNPVILRKSEVLSAKVDKKYILSDKLWGYLKAYAEKHRAKGNGFGYGIADPEGVTRTLSARYHKDGSEILISMGKGKNPRRLTPQECKKLMGFPKEFDIDFGVSDTQLYRQFGNSVAVPVVRAVVKEVMGYMEQNKIDTYCAREQEVAYPEVEDSQTRITA